MIRALFIFAVGAASLLNATDAFSDDASRLLRKAPASAWSWSGAYIGGHIGGGHGTARVDNPYGASIYGDAIRTPMALAGAQVGYNWQQPGSRWVFGIEADVSLLDSDGTDTCLAYSGLFVSANCRMRQDLMGSLTGRVGHVFGEGGRSLVYAKGGAALLASRFAMKTNGVEFMHEAEQSSDRVQVGWTAGLGIERAVSPAWSVKLEYDYARFGSRSVAAPDGGLQTIPLDPASLVTIGGTPTTLRPDSHVVKLGLNYRIGQGSGADWGDRPVVPAASFGSGWTAELGARYWYSQGRYQNDLGMSTDLAQQNALISRLTYETTGQSGEVFGRIESPHRIFVKGFAGGGLTSGHINDEDWFPTNLDNPMAYSNTNSRVTGQIAYATLDMGYNFFSAPRVTVGAFAGYNFYRDHKKAYGCTQIAYPVVSPICGVPEPTTSLMLSQNEDWHSLRVGFNGTIELVSDLKLTADAAYLPYAAIRALDIHHQHTQAASPNSPAWGSGRGVQLEAVLTYDVTPRFSIGLGGRYWAMWATDVLTASFGSAVATQTLPIRVERFGTFMQASYKFGSVH